MSRSAGVSDDHLPIHRHFFQEEDAVPVQDLLGETVAYLCPGCLERVRSYRTPIMAIDSPDLGQYHHSAWLDEGSE